ncbi:MAG: hypothetical protein KGY80_03905 [Candidatus Thorarchaeota archaeon]|nr:hypothetical protein [Candidatus Thorarchaeota archaeon]
MAVLGFFPIASRANGIFYNLDTSGLESENGSFKLLLSKEMGPHYRFFDRVENTTEFHLKLIRLFEFEDTNGDGVYTNVSDTILPPPIGLQSGNWVFKGFTYEQQNGSIQELQFHLNGSDFSPIQSSLKIGLRHYIDVTNTSIVKFDIILSGWQWANENSKLCLAAVIGSSDRNGTSISKANATQKRSRIAFQSAFLSYPLNASFNSTPAEVNVSLGEFPEQDDGQGVLFCFPNFGDNTLFYDPTIGLKDLSSTTTLTTSTTTETTTTPPTTGTTTSTTIPSNGRVLGAEEFIFLAAGTTIVVGALVLTVSRD